MVSHYPIMHRSDSKVRYFRYMRTPASCSNRTARRVYFHLPTCRHSASSRCLWQSYTDQISSPQRKDGNIPPAFGKFVPSPAEILSTVTPCTAHFCRIDDIQQSKD